MALAIRDWRTKRNAYPRPRHLTYNLGPSASPLSSSSAEKKQIACRYEHYRRWKRKVQSLLMMQAECPAEPVGDAGHTARGHFSDDGYC